MDGVTFHEVLKNFILLFTVIDPLGVIPVFLNYTKHYPANRSKSMAIRASVYAFLILTFFLVAGQLLFEAMDLPLAALQVAGGIILFLFALTMIFGDNRKDSQTSITDHETALFPIAIPGIASPGAILAVILLTDNHRFSISHQSVTLISVFVILLITCALLIGVKHIHKLIGDAGTSLLSRIMGLILASMAVNFTLQGILTYFK